MSVTMLPHSGSSRRAPLSIYYQATVSSGTKNQAVLRRDHTQEKEKVHTVHQSQCLKVYLALHFPTGAMLFHGCECRKCWKLLTAASKEFLTFPWMMLTHKSEILVTWWLFRNVCGISALQLTIMDRSW